MKTRLLLLFSAFLATGAVKAQSDTTYHLQHFLPDSANFITCLDWVYCIAGDTVINGKKMKKVYDSAVKPDNYYAAIHEDTLNAKYYVIYKDETDEKLFMDFSSNVGGNIMVSDQYETLKVQVDSVNYDEKGRKVVFLRSECGDFDCWVEGLGSTRFMLFRPTYCIVDITVPPLKKITIGDSIVYEQYTNDDCETFSYSSVITITTKFNTYPNPAKNFLIIDAEDYDCYTYEIISSSGAVQQSGELTPSIDISRLPSGTKLIVVKDDNGNVLYTSKFIKNMNTK